ncbi:MAG: class I SAM-dependent methyltransferase [Candidatus Hodarchaeota archaeon]
MPKKKTVEEIYDRYAVGYSSGDFAPSAFDNARTAMTFADDITWFFLQKYAPKDRNLAYILDAGAGDGYWAQKFLELGYKNIVLVDLSQKMLDQAKERLNKLAVKKNVQFVKTDILNLNEIQTNTFDYVFSQYDAVSYCMNPQIAIKQLTRVAKPRAYVIVCLDTKFRRVPEFIETKQIKTAVKLLRSNVSNEFGHPQYNFSWEELAENFAKAGLEVIEAVGAPVFMHQIDEDILNELEQDPEIRGELLNIELQYCTDKSLINFAGHLQMIGKKK